MEFRVLGPVEVWLAGRPAAAGHARQRAVLAVLLLEAGHMVPLGVLIDRVWGENPPQSVRNVVYGYVARLKAVLASGQDSGVTLSRHQGGYLLQASPQQVDLYRFRGLVTEARAAAGAGDERAAVALDEAVALWQGPPLGGVDSPWLKAMRATLELERTAAVLDLNDIRLRCGQHGALVSELVEQATESPADERLIGQLMLALYRSGRQPEALRWFEETRRHLANELGANPGPDLRAVHERILHADPALAAPGRVSGGRAGPIPRELPADAPSFTGRAAELAKLGDLLATPTGTQTSARTNQAAAASAGDRRVTAAVISAVSGTAGVGKTALAVHWAHQAADRFPDGQLYVNLRGYDPDRPMTAAEALSGFLRALGVPGQDIPPGQDERAARYRSLLSDKQMLVVLDNASAVEQVRPLLPGCAACAVLVTSRDSLAGLVAWHGAARLDLDLLPLAEAVRLLRALIGARVDADWDAAAALAAQCCRLPLALRVAAELAVARPGASLAALVDELADQQGRLDLLDADGDPRTAVRAVFSWSYRHLDTPAARAFRLAGLHPGPDFDAYAVAALSGTTLERARRALDVLVRAHLIQPAGPDRYSLHDLLRAYARELAANQDGEEQLRAALTRLFDHYLHTAAVAMDTLHPAERHRRPSIPDPVTPAPPVTDPAAAQAWLDAERAALVAAGHAVAHDFPARATQLAATLFRYLDSGSHYPEAIIIHSYARDAARRVADRAAEATALDSLGVVFYRQGDYRQATGRFQEALVLFRQSGDRSGEARTLHHLGMVFHVQGQYQRAIDLAWQTVELFRETGDQFGEAQALEALGLLTRQRGRYQDATSHHRRALALRRELGDVSGQAYSLDNLGTVYLRQGSYEVAARRLHQALKLFRQVGDRSGEADVLINLGAVYLGQRHPSRAASHIEQALALSREIGDQDSEADALNGLGDVLVATGRSDEAYASHIAALQLARQIGDRYQQARAHDGLGYACQAVDDAVEARRHWQEALTLFTEIGVPEADEVRERLATNPDQRQREPSG
jgi:DNA-binding SARP family transcriptional activator/Tfp pilus assembly protein PilF